MTNHNGFQGDKSFLQSIILLTLEDINDLIELRNFVPICARCKNIKDEENY